MNRLLLFNRYVDWSILNEGVTIPSRFQNDLFGAIGRTIKRGEKIQIPVSISGKTYSVILTNIDFDQNKYPDHGDIIQFRWSKNSDIAQDLQKIFQRSYAALYGYRSAQDTASSEKPKIEESITFLYNATEKRIEIEYINSLDLNEIKPVLSKMTEERFEREQNYYRADITANLLYRDAVQKIRMIDRTIIKDLKILYDFHCQICGTSFDRYNVQYMEAHHIDPFVRSLNNDSNNILIICPNHHRIIHTAKPFFFYNGAYFLYPNGVKEKVSYNKHIAG